MTPVKIRTLKADEIEVRVQSVGKTKSGSVGAVLLIYKDARVDMKILDEVFGIYGWKRSHELIDGKLFCTISIKDPDTGEWVSKQDVGVESNTEKEKGQASDAFKRAGFNIGIGRELYTAPFIWVELFDDEYYSGNVNGKTIYRVNSWVRFSVSDIQYSQDGVITALTLVDKSGRVRYTMNGDGGAQKDSAQQASAPSTQRPVVNSQNNNPNSPSPDMKCPVCGGNISQAERDYSVKKFGREMCRACQRKAK